MKAVPRIADKYAEGACDVAILGDNPNGKNGSKKGETHPKRCISPHFETIKS